MGLLARTPRHPIVLLAAGFVVMVFASDVAAVQIKTTWLTVNPPKDIIIRVALLSLGLVLLSFGLYAIIAPSAARQRVAQITIGLIATGVAAAATWSFVVGLEPEQDEIFEAWAWELNAAQEPVIQCTFRPRPLRNLLGSDRGLLAIVYPADRSLDFDKKTRFITSTVFAPPLNDDPFDIEFSASKLGELAWGTDLIIDLRSVPLSIKPANAANVQALLDMDAKPIVWRRTRIRSSDLNVQAFRWWFRSFDADGQAAVRSELCPK